MKKSRKNQLIALAVVVAFGFIHFLFGQVILTFIAKHILTHVISVVVVLLFVYLIYCVIINEDPLNSKGEYFDGEEDEDYPANKCPDFVEGPND